MKLNPFTLTQKVSRFISTKLNIRKIYVRQTARAYIFCPERKQFLVGRGMLPPFNFHLPGGGMDKDEAQENALRRELFEELDIVKEDIDSIVYVDSNDHFVYGIPHISFVYFIVIRDKERLIPRKVSWELPEAKWVTYEELKDVVGEKRTKRQLALVTGDILTGII